MKKNFYCFLCFNLLYNIDIETKPEAMDKKIDLTLISHICYSDGIGRMAINWFGMLNNEIDIDAIACGYVSQPDLPKGLVLRSIQEKNVEPSKVSALLFPVGLGNTVAYIPKSNIKIAYSMVESTRVHPSWVERLNNFFDLVVVPDEFLVKVYKDSGVKLPIFVLPIPLNLDDFLGAPTKCKANQKFVFGMSGGFGESKNHKMVIDAFAKNFQNNQNVELVLHGHHSGDIADLYYALIDYVREKNINNVRFSDAIYSHEEFLNFMNGLDCYVLLSKGEGFSITPREALAMGIPCILANNTAQRTICATGFVCTVKSDIHEPKYLPGYNDNSIGEIFSCTLNDAADAMLDVYNNYQSYLLKAQAGKRWVLQYTPNRLKAKYLNLIRPQKVILGARNIVTDTFFMTNNKNLYAKYTHLISQNKTSYTKNIYPTANQAD